MSDFVVIPNGQDFIVADNSNPMAVFYDLAVRAGLVDQIDKAWLARTIQYCDQEVPLK